MNLGTLEAIWVKRAARGPMDRHKAATLVANRGIVGNADQGRRRQVTIIAKERWHELMDETGAMLDPSVRRANLMVSGIDLTDSRGKTLQIGSVRIQIYNETRPCERMDEAHFGLQAAMRKKWGGGAFGVVLDDGEIQVGDPVHWVSP